MQEQIDMRGSAAPAVSAFVWRFVYALAQVPGFLELYYCSEKHHSVRIKHLAWWSFEIDLE